MHPVVNRSLWIAAALMAPFLYLLSVTPISIAVYGRGSGTCLGEAMNGQEAWLEKYYMYPYWLCEENTPLHKPLDAYDRWWWRVTKP